MRSALPVATLAGAVLIILVVAAGGFLASRPGPVDVAAASASPSPAAASASPAAASASPAPTSPPSPSVAPSAPVVVPTPEPTVGPCDPASLAARITSWEGAAGSRIANVTLVNQGTLACLLEARNRPQLVAGDGGVLIDGTNPATTTVLTLEPGARAGTAVSAGNYCKPAPVPPVSVAFVFGDGRRLLAEAVSPDDVTLPPCNGPSQPGTIDMHPWAPAP